MGLDATYLVAGQVARGADVKQFYNLLIGTMKDQPVLFNNRLTLTRDAAATPSILTYLVVTGTNDTAVAAEANDVYLNLARTLQFTAASVPALQRAVRVAAPTYSATGAAVLAHAATLSISGPPIAGTNLTLTTGSALYAESGYIRIAELTGGFAYGVGSTAPLDISNAGSPEGVRTAPPGSTCRDRTNGAFYVKVSGTGNVGWLVMGGTTVKSVQRGTIVMGGSASVSAVITSVDLSKSFVNNLGYEGGSNLSNIACRLKLADATHVQSDRNATGSGANVNYEVIEFF